MHWGGLQGIHIYRIQVLQVHQGTSLKAAFMRASESAPAPAQHVPCHYCAPCNVHIFARNITLGHRIVEEIVRDDTPGLMEMTRPPVCRCRKQLRPKALPQWRWGRP